MAKRNRLIGMKIFLGISLAIILFSLFNLGVATFYEKPDYDDYCGEITGRPPIIYKEDTNDTAMQELDLTCRNEYNLAREKYENNIFYVFVIAGLILAVSGLFITNLSFQIVGLGAGVGLIIEGIIRNLNNKIPAFIAGILVFAIFSYFVWRKVKD